MLFVKKSVAVICLIAFAISTTGISIQKHSCRMSGTTKVALFPEIFGNTVSCCEMKTPVASNHCNSVSTVPCCQNVFTYAKIISLYVYSFTGANLIKQLFTIPVIDFMQLVSNDIPVKSIFHYYKPPPVKYYGTKLLHFIHNIKIALPC
jgi:hypothetical protein